MDIEETLTDGSLLAELGVRISRHRIRRQLTQAELAKEAGVSKRTLERIESGSSTQMSSFLRICRALGLLENLDSFVPRPLPSPMAQLALQGKERQRASSKKKLEQPDEVAEWSWGDVE